MRYTLKNVMPIWSNPVVVRDMRVRMRGSRAFWNQGIYLAILSIIAVTGYGASINGFGTGSKGLDPVAAQQSLQGFYYWIFGCLALAICLIAPALTAVAVISERKLQTLDLLVTTPMTSMQMLTGKLTSSLAFIVLLLILSIPASALCVILGGATLSDVLQTYFILVIDGVLLSAIGLTFSCSASQYLQAIAGTYAAIFFLFITSFLPYSAAIGPVSAVSTSLPAIAAITELDPLVAVFKPGIVVSVFGTDVPGSMAASVVCFIVVRLLLTRSAIRLKMYGVGLIASLRRQILFATFATMLLVGQAAQRGSLTSSYSQSVVIYVSALVFGISAFFLPPLFVPAKDEDGPPEQTITGRFNVLKSFSAEYAGALPFFQIWLLCAIGGNVAGMLMPSGPLIGSGVTGSAPIGTVVPWQAVLTAAGYMYFYLSGLGFLFWSIARRCAWFSATSAQAQPLSFTILAFIFLLPLAVLVVQNQLHTGDYNAFDSWVVNTWLLLPLKLTADRPSHNDWTGYGIYGGIAYLLGNIVYPFWLNVTPGARAYSRSAKIAARTRT